VSQVHDALRRAPRKRDAPKKKARALRADAVLAALGSPQGRRSGARERLGIALGGVLGRSAALAARMK